MQKSIFLAALLALAGVVIGAVAYAQLSGEAGAAPPPPTTQLVREQNLDGSGLIRVHEQGTANVTVGNLPLDGQGNLRTSIEPAGFRLLTLGTNLSLGPGASVTTNFTDISACAGLFMQLYVRSTGAIASAPQSPLVDIEVLPSVDGQRPDGRMGPLTFTSPGPASPDLKAVALFLGIAFGPQIQVSLAGHPDIQPQSVSVFLHCFPD